MSYTEMNFASGGASSAEKVSYNNAISGLSATNVQSAIDEVASRSTVEKVNTTFTIGGTDTKENVATFQLEKGTYILGLKATPQFNGTNGFDTYFDIAFGTELMVTQGIFVWSDYRYGFAYTVDSDKTISVRVRTNKTTGGNFSLVIDATKIG